MVISFALITANEFFQKNLNRKKASLSSAFLWFFFLYVPFSLQKKRKKPSSLLPPPPPSYHSANDDYVFKTTISTTTTTTMKTTRKTFRFVVPFKHSHFILGCTIWTFSFSFSFFGIVYFYGYLSFTLGIQFFFLVKSKITEPNYHHQ